MDSYLELTKNILLIVSYGYAFYKFFIDTKNGNKKNDPHDGVLVEVKPAMPEKFKGRNISTLTTEELVDLSKTKAMGKPFIWRIIRSRGEQAVKDYGWKIGYKEGWVYNQLDEMKDIKFNDKVL